MSATDPCLPGGTVACDRTRPREGRLRADVEHLGLGAVARRLPVRPSLRAGNDDGDRLVVERRVHLLGALDGHVLERLVRALELVDGLDVLRRHLVRDEGRIARDRLRLGGLLRRELRHRLLGDRQERLARLPVEQVEPAGLRCLGEALLPVDVEQDDGARAVVVPDVVVDLLVVPAVLSGLGVDRDDRGREQVVALALAAVQVGGGVPGGEVEQAELGVDGRASARPERRPSSTRRCPGPRVVARLAGRRDGPEAPLQLARRRVERGDAAAEPNSPPEPPTITMPS